MTDSKNNILLQHSIQRPGAVQEYDVHCCRYFRYDNSYCFGGNFTYSRDYWQPYLSYGACLHFADRDIVYLFKSDNALSPSKYLPFFSKLKLTGGHFFQAFFRCRR